MAKASSTRGRGRVKEPHILRSRQPHRANWPAVDAGRAHADKELPVKTRVSGDSRALAQRLIKLCHEHSDSMQVRPC